MILFSTHQLRDIRAEILDPLPVDSAEVLNALFEAEVWELGDFTFASGRRANNKFQADKLFHPKNRQPFRTVLVALGRLAQPSQPDALWGVPSGGQFIARHLGAVLDMPVIRLAKDKNEPGLKTYRYKSRATERQAHQASRKVGVEDIVTELTSSEGIGLLLGMEDSVAEVAIMRRGDPALEKKLPWPVHAAVNRQVPNIITPDHPFFQQYNHVAVRQAA